MYTDSQIISGLSPTALHFTVPGGLFTSIKVVRHSVAGKCVDSVRMRHATQGRTATDGTYLI
jgi:hypothetical protein